MQRGEIGGRYRKMVTEVAADRAPAVPGDDAVVADAVSGVGRPLRHVRVLSMEQAAALPFATRHLADLGADVIRVESHRRRGSDLDNIELTRNKRQLALDLAGPGGPEAFRRVAQHCDVVAHNFTPRVVRKFGIDYDSLRATHPDLIYVSLTGFGTTGPWSDRPLFGPGAEAVSGQNLLIGDPDGWPGRPGTITYADNTCGLYATFAILAALDERDRTGAGTHIDISLYETSVSMLGPVLAERALGAEPRRTLNGDAGLAVHGVFATSGVDRYVAIAAPAGQLDDVRRLLGAADTSEAALTAALATRDGEEVAATLQAAGVAAAVVADSAALLTDPHLWARGYFARVERHSGGLHGEYEYTGPAWGGGAALRLDEARPVGADSRAVLGELGGLADSEIDQLFGDGTVGDPPGGPPRPAPAAEIRIQRGELTRVDADFRTRITAAKSEAHPPDPGADSPTHSTAGAAGTDPLTAPRPDSPAGAGTDPPTASRPDSPAGAGLRHTRARTRRALDVSSGVGAAYAARILADAGWDVVKVEPDAGDPLRAQESRWGGGAGGAFSVVNHGKRSVVVPDFDALRALAAAADVVIGDFSPPGLAAAGLPADAYRTLQPSCAIVSLSPFGRCGPKSGWAATDLIVQAASGLLYLTGEWDQPPLQLPPYHAALVGALAAASATMAAVASSGQDGRRHAVDVSMVEAVASYGYTPITAYVHRGEVTRREQRIKAGLRMVPARDGYVYCAPGAVASMRMDGVAQLLDEPRLAEERFQTAEGRMQHWDEFLELFVPPFQTRTAPEWCEAAEALHMTFALVQSVDDLFTCPQLDQRRLLQTVGGPHGTPLRIPGAAYQRSPTDPTTATDRAGATHLGPAPERPGRDTTQVLAEWIDRKGDPVA